LITRIDGAQRRGYSAVFSFADFCGLLCPMPAYVIVELDIVDPAGFEKYKKAVVPLVEKYGGKYIAVSDAVERLEGDWNPKRIVILQFDSMQRAREWHGCEEYREPRKMRQRSARTKMILVEGL
jgi:uncharacterized protein (DUF1330 family)